MDLDQAQGGQVTGWAHASIGRACLKDSVITERTKYLIEDHILKKIF